MLTMSAPPKQRDIIFRYYPFVLSKAIFLGFTFLCPGNRNLFKGAFQGILYLSTFRLLTGLDICPGSINTLRYKLYPEDAIEDDTTDSTTEKKNNELGPMLQQQGSINPRANLNTLSSQYSSRAPTDQKINVRRRDSVLKFVGDRESLRFRPDKPQSLGPELLRHQNKVQFDTQQLSPLLSQCLGRESTSMGVKHFVQRTEPVSYCKSGGVETFQSHSDNSTISDEDQRLKKYHSLARELKMESLKAKFEHRKAMKELALERKIVLSGGKMKIQSFAASIMDASK
jgi:hypothetical protein